MIETSATLRARTPRTFKGLTSDFQVVTVININSVIRSYIFKNQWYEIYFFLNLWVFVLLLNFHTWFYMIFKFVSNQLYGFSATPIVSIFFFWSALLHKTRGLPRWEILELGWCRYKEIQRTVVTSFYNISPSAAHSPSTCKYHF